MKQRFILLLSVFLPLLSCTDQIDGLTFETISPSVAAPIGKLTLKASNLSSLSDSIIFREGESNVIELYYDVSLLETTIFDRFTLKDQAFANDVPFDAAAFNNGQVTINTPEEYSSFTISNIDLSDPVPALTSYIFKGGSITVSTDKNFDHNTVTTISFPTLTKGGSPLSFNLNNVETFSELLEGYELDLTGTDGSKTNTIEYELSTLITETGTDNNGTLSVSFSMENMDFSFLAGDLRKYRFDDVTGSFELGLPVDEVPDNIRFTDPKVDIRVRNSSGIPFGLNIREISATDENGQKRLVTGDFQTEAPVLDAAIVPGELAESSYLINTTNSDNLVDFISDIPQKVFFDGFVEANPDETTTANNFVTDSSAVGIFAQLILPMTGYVNNYALTQSISGVDLNLSESDGVTLENVNLRMISENAFPVSIALQLYFIDSVDANSEIVLDSLFESFDESIISPSGEVNSAGLVSNATTLLSDILVDNEKYERIKTSNKIRVVGTLFSPGANDTNPKSVKVTTDNYLTISLGLSAQATVNPKNL